MRVRTALDWERVSGELRASIHTAPARCKKDLTRMIGHIEDLVHKLANEEVTLRRNKKFTSPASERLLAEINESINEYEKWLMLALLQYG
jgi:hypothetical protein